MRTSTILRKTKALIARPRNWCKGIRQMKSTDGRNQYCLIGAIHTAANGTPWGNYTIDIIRAKDLLSLFTEPANIVAFNDSNDTKHKDVMLILDAAIGVAECEEGAK